MNSYNYNRNYGCRVKEIVENGLLCGKPYKKKLIQKLFMPKNRHVETF